MAPGATWWWEHFLKSIFVPSTPKKPHVESFEKIKDLKKLRGLGLKRHIVDEPLSPLPPNFVWLINRDLLIGLKFVLHIGFWVLYKVRKSISKMCTVRPLYKGTFMTENPIMYRYLCVKFLFYFIKFHNILVF